MGKGKVLRARGQAQWIKAQWIKAQWIKAQWIKRKGFSARGQASGVNGQRIIDDRVNSTDRAIQPEDCTPKR